MCGIFFTCNRECFHNPSQYLNQCLFKRGPDALRAAHRSIPIVPSGKTGLDRSKPSQNHCLSFVSSVLALRGDCIVSQPLEDLHTPSESLLCWNGEAWKVDGEAIVGHDAEFIFDLLVRSTHTSYDANESQQSELSLQRVLSVMSSISGSYAFVFYDAHHRRVFFARDPLGRRSLVMRQQSNESIQICSICDKEDLQGWKEVDADGIYVYRFDSCIPPMEAKDCMSGQGKDSKILRIPWTSSDSATESKYALTLPFPQFDQSTIMPDDFRLNTTSPSIDKMARLLHASLKLRVNAFSRAESASPPLAILFSGGVDCTLIARMIHEIIPQDHDVDLLNVAFENPRVVQAAAVNSKMASPLRSIYSLCPDRVTGLSSLSELRATCPGRSWRFVSIDVPYLETLAHRSQIKSLIYPHNTEMDLSISCALYFAARGKGTVHDVNTSNVMSYTTPARVLMSGLGADELFGGYTRHTAAFNRHSYSGLVKELELDFRRLGQRNLGRDDRVISHWGREVRYPYLDEDLVSRTLQTPVWEKCGFGQSTTSDHTAGVALEPGKKLLRLLAWKLGLEGAAMEKKRAIQFGARTAKMELGRTRGKSVLS